MASILLSGLVSCGGKTTSEEDNALGKRIELKYADQFSIEEMDDGSAFIRIEDGLNYLVLPEGMDIPHWAKNSKEKFTTIYRPLDSIYLAASSAFDLFLKIGAEGFVTMTSTKASDWGIPEVKELVESGDVVYVGKYSEPNYEAILESECDLAIESTMIYHSPNTKESLESLGVPVMVERSSYEAEPLGRLEWIKLYGLLLDKEDEANLFFDSMAEKYEKIVAETDKKVAEDRPEVAFFSISSNNYATVRKPGDYISKMIYVAGGRYSMEELPVDDDNALSTTNIQLESFFDYVVDSDYLIYNTAIQGEIKTKAELIDKFGELEKTKAVKDGNIWATRKSLFQKSSGLADMTEELYLIISGQGEGKALEYFVKLE